MDRKTRQRRVAGSSSNQRKESSRVHLFKAKVLGALKTCSPHAERPKRRRIPQQRHCVTPAADVAVKRAQPRRGFQQRCDVHRLQGAAPGPAREVPGAQLEERRSVVARKNPVVLKFGEGVVHDQLKHILNKKPLHYMEWDPLPQFPPRKLRHVDRRLNPHTGAALPDPARDDLRYERNYFVPDQHFNRVPVPRRYSDAYWWRELQARRVQCPISWVERKFQDPRLRERYSFEDLSFEKKFFFTVDDVVAHARQERR